jgi:hypothetical protein
MKKVAAIAGLCAALVLVVCDQSNNPAGTGGTGQNSTNYTYTVSGDTIIVYTPLVTQIRSSCLNNTLVSRLDTLEEASIDTLTFVLTDNGNTLTLDQKAVLTRVGTGTGIQGTWTAISESLTLTIGPSTITSTVTRDYADNFVKVWNRRPPADQVTVAKASANLVTLTGTTTGEVVTILWSGAGDMTYSSNGKTTTTVYENPVACPNSPPDWYGAFLSANRTTPGQMKTAAAVAADKPRWLDALR